MNQPSAEDIVDLLFNFDGVVFNNLDEKFFLEFSKYLLDRYLLIDKSEPIPGAVSADILLDIYTKPDLRDGLFVATILDLFDIYPKGTVARLTGEVEFHKQNAGCWKADVDKLQAEVDRLKGENDRLYRQCNYLANFILEKEKPEAVGCGKWYDTPPKLCGGHNTCPDCQAKANQPETPESSKKVQLPEVPDWGEVAPSQWARKTDEFMLAVKAHLEGGE